MDKPATKTCVYGLCETAVPVKLGSQTIGFLQTGQVLRKNPSNTSFRLAVKEAAKRGVSIDNDETRRAFFGTKVLSRKKLNAASGLLEVFSSQLSMMSNQLAVQRTVTEPLAIATARQFISDHHKEELSLTRIATAVHVEYFRLSKMFHKHTGLKFTEFLGRTRVEAAKNLLLNVNLNISEIGFESGFQSLTHFNRMFKKITGDSPKQYRSKLAGVGTCGCLIL